MDDREIYEHEEYLDWLATRRSTSEDVPAGD